MKGTYCLIIKVSKDIKIKVGTALGEIEFKKGTYVYVGSAMNSLIARVKRHLSDDKKKHWHVDYLLLDENSYIEDVIINISDEKVECLLASHIQQNEKVIANFGCSDCKCKSHLVYFENKKRAIAKTEKVFNELNLKITRFQSVL